MNYNATKCDQIWWITAFRSEATQGVWGIRPPVNQIFRHEKRPDLPVFFRASGGNRTRTAFSGQGILSPSCLPFHHQGDGTAKIVYFFQFGKTGKRHVLLKIPGQARNDKKRSPAMTMRDSRDKPENDAKREPGNDGQSPRMTKRTTGRPKSLPR